MRSSTSLFVLALAMGATGADAAVTFVRAYAEARVGVTATTEPPMGGTQSGSATTLPTAAFGYAQQGMVTGDGSAASGSSSTYVTFDDAASGTLALSGSGIATSSDPQRGSTAQAFNEFFYDFSSDTDFRIDLSYEVLSAGTGAELPDLRFDLLARPGTATVFSFRHAVDVGTATSGPIAAGDYRLRIRNDRIVGVSAGGSTTLASNSLRGSVGFAISEVPGVPEPATWATMMLGFGVVGAAARRRRRAAATS